MRILVVEDEPGIAELMSRGLEAEGYAVSHVADGPTAEAMALTDDFDLVLLDVMLPGKSGFEILREIRAHRADLPVVMLTALGDTRDVVEGLDLGANDYVTKPFEFDELVARVRAQLRRPGQRESAVLTSGDLQVDLRTRKVTRNGDEIRLTAREFELLVYLMRHPDQVLSRTQILNAVWGYDFDPGTNVLEVYIGYLRRKLAASNGPAPIETVRNAGYKLVTDSD
jgi:DNA-binding response OmpR family regulator